MKALASILLAISPWLIIANAVAEEPDGKGPMFAFLALNNNEISDQGAMEKALKEVFGEETQIKDLEIDEKSMTVVIDDNLCMLGLMDAPIPWTDLEGPCATAYWWDGATEKMKAHKAHYIAIVLGEQGSQLERAVLLTKLIAAGAIAHDSAGVYWGHGTLVHEPAAFIEQAKEVTAEEPPVNLWIDVRFWRGDDGKMYFATTGMDYFDGMEVELSTDGDPKRAFGLVSGAAYLQLLGDTFADGDTIGFGPNDKVKTTHEKSFWDREGKVLRIHL